MDNFFSELKRRHIYRVAATYAVVAWVLIQLVNNITPMLNLPNSVGTVVLVLLAVGFPVALLFAWIHQLAPADGAAAKPATSTLDYVLIGALAIVISLVSYQQLASPGARTAQQQPSSAPTSLPARPGGISVAVLPFANMSGDAGQEFFSDGMTEEINGALAKVPDLRVVGRTSAFQFKGQSKDLRAIGQSLSARYLIEGSVRKAGAQVRIAAQLIRADDGVQLWSESYDRELTNIFAIQEDIAQAIAKALRVPLGLRQGEALVSNRTIDIDSYQQYLRARSLVRARAVNEAVAALKLAVVRTPDYAPAWALLAVAHRLAPFYQGVFRVISSEEARRSVLSSLDEAENAAQKAIRLDPKHSGGYAGMATVETFRGKWAAAEDHYHQALTLDPNDADALFQYSTMLYRTGRLKDSLRLFEQLRALEPFVPIYNINAGLTLQINGRSEAAIRLFEAIPQQGPTGYLRNVLLAHSYAAAGFYTNAADTLLAIPEQNLVSRRSIENAALLLRGVPAQVKSPDTLPALEGELGFVYAFVGAPNRMLEFPERAVAINYAGINALGYLWDPLNSRLRTTDRFKELLRAEGLVDYWRARGWPDLCRPMGADDFVCD